MPNQRLTQTQRQELKLSPQQIQLMKLLQLPLIELEQRIKEEMEINPALEDVRDNDYDDNEPTVDEPTDENDNAFLPKLVEEDFGAPFGVIRYTKDHVISVQNDVDTQYQAYLDVQNELVAAYNELREECAQKYFHKAYAELEEDQQKRIQKIYPQKISEAEPKNYGN